MALASPQQWLMLALSFLHGYGNEAVKTELRYQLSAPHGIAKMWWKAHTNFIDAAKVIGNLTVLRCALDVQAQRRAKCAALRIPTTPAGAWPGRAAQCA
jgi:hypothetical protein